MTIEIDRWHQSLALRGPQSAPHAARARVDALARSAAPALAAALQERLAHHGGEVMRMRRLDVALTVDLGRPSDETAPGYAATLARHIADAIEDGGEDVVRFTDRCAYHAAFALALAAGDAHQRWVFEEFDGLALLAPGAALRTLFERHPDAAWALLARLAHQPAVFALLAGADALRVLDVLIGEALPGSAPPRLPPPSVLGCPAAAVLERMARAAAAGCATDSALLAAAIAALPASLAASTSAAPSDAEINARIGLAQRLNTLAPQLRAGPGVPHAGQPRAANTSEPSPIEEMPCASAGLVVLLDELDAFLAPQGRRGALALAALAAAAAPEDAQRVWNDAAWRALFGIEIEWDIADLGTALTALDVDATMDWMEAANSGAASASRGNARRWRDAQGRTRGLDDATGLWCSASGAGVAERAAWRRARTDERELDHALLHALPAPWRGLVAAAAQFAWRRVAWRVPGLRDSGLPWLRRNLLGGDGSAQRIDDTHWHWRCPRAPLHVLLAMTSLGARERHWRGPPECRLSLEFHG